MYKKKKKTAYNKSKNIFDNFIKLMIKMVVSHRYKTKLGGQKHLLYLYK